MKSLAFPLLLGIRALARTFYRFDSGFVGKVPADPWSGIRLVAILNHTSLYEPLFAGAVPVSFLRRIATRGVIPVAEKTLKRPFVGRFFRLVAPDVVPVTRKRDRTWKALTERVSQDSLVIILPEGRMKRANGLDKDGNPMTVRGGIADLLEVIPEGRMLLAYSGGLHHVQVPGQLNPRLFQLLRIRFELVDIAAYRTALESAAGEDGSIKLAVVADLERRRDHYCLPLERATLRDVE